MRRAAPSTKCSSGSGTSSAVAQRRQLDLRNVQPIQQIRAKITFGCPRREISL
jgi:hypothetical protein